MKKALLALLLFTATALAAETPLPPRCEAIVEEAQTLYNTSSYDDLLRLGESYEIAAQCFEEGGVSSEASEHYILAGDYYTGAADGMTADIKVQAALYASAGDSYLNSKKPEILEQAKSSYTKVVNLSNTYPSLVSKEQRTHADEMLAKINNPAVNDIVNPPMPTTEIDFILLALLVIILIGFIAVALYKR